MDRPDTHDTRPAPGSQSRLHATTAGKGPRLVLAHGFTQTGSIWGPMSDDLAADHEVVAVDLPGHGGSAEVRADLGAGARLLVDVGGRAAYLGYSMGARFCLQAALSFSDRVRSLVLLSGTAGIEDDRLRAERVASDEVLAAELYPLPAAGQPGGGQVGEDQERDDQVRVDAFLQRWLARPLFAGIPEGSTGLAVRRTNTAAGLASSLRLAGTGGQPSLWDQLHSLDMPVLIITGERDTKFTALGGRMVRAIGSNASHAVVPGVGHTPHLEDPGPVTALVRDHLDRRSG